MLNKIRKGAKDVLGSVLSIYSNLSSLVTIFEDLTYKSYAAFTGEINIKVSTFCEEYKFTGTYNIFGIRQGDYKASCNRIQKSDFIINAPEDNRTEIHYRLYEDGVL